MRRTDLALGWKSIPGYRHQVEGRENEDAVLVSQEHPRCDAVMLVADGVGGHREPKRAAETAARAAWQFLADEGRWGERTDDPRAPLRVLQEAMRYANAAVVRLAPLAGSGKPPGSTLTVAIVTEGRLYVAHAGDGSTFLMRDGRLQPLVGSEERREGNRPQSFLGLAPRIEIEESLAELRPGDRVLICTDGLTRYFGAVAAARPAGRGGVEAGPGGGALHEVLGRPGAEPQAIANQLTAHSRTDQYDDDTTVVVAEVTGVRTVPDPVPAREEAAERRDRHAAVGGAAQDETTAGRPPLALAAAALGAVVLAVALGFGLGRWLGHGPGSGGGARPAAGPESLSVGPVAGLPRDPIVLYDPDGKRMFALQPWPQRDPPRGGVLPLVGVRLGRDGQLVETGTWRLDARRGRLTDPHGAFFFVDVDADRGLIAVRHAGTLRVITHPAAGQVYLDGVLLGPAPVQRRVPAGSHRVRIEWRSGQSYEGSVEVPTRGSILLEQAP